MSRIITMNDLEDSDVLFFDYLVKSSRREREVERNLTERIKDLFADNVFPTILATVAGMSLLDKRRIERVILNQFNGVQDEYQQILQEEGMAVAQIGANRTISHLQQAGQSVSFMDVTDRVEGFIRNATFEASQQTMDRMIGDVMGTLSDGVSEGVGIDGMTEMLEGQFNNMEQYELERIAKTETHSYANMSKFEVEKELGVEFHEWLTDIRETTRGQRPYDWADHIEMNGQIVRVDDEFSNGLKYPGDKSGNPEEYISCNCDLVPYLMPEGKMPPVGMAYFYENDLRNVS